MLNDSDFMEDGSSFDFESDDEYLLDPMIATVGVLSDKSVDGKSTPDPIYIAWSLLDFIQLLYIEKFLTLKGAMLPGCSDTILLSLLHYCHWQPDEVINGYYDGRDRLFKGAGISLDLVQSTFTVKPFECSVCCEAYNSTTVYSLACNHEYCALCYYSYLSNEIGHGALISCIQPDCSYTIPHADIEKLCDLQEHDEHILKKNPALLNEYRLLAASAKIYISSHSQYKWCPATDCTNFVELLLSANGSAENEVDNLAIQNISCVLIVRCLDSHEFCFGCSYENHLPCSCFILKKWVKKCQDDSETANWIDANTQGCPRCESAIEKNGGCNHMKCQTCEYEFCWICRGDWPQHNSSYYQCNRFKEDKLEQESRKTKSRLSLARYMHFYKRFTVHLSSMDGDRRTLQRINKAAAVYMETRRQDKGTGLLSWNDIEFLPNAIKSLTNGRKTLKWTYVFAFYLNESNFSEIFEANQNYLNKAVEDLSEIFENILRKRLRKNTDSSEEAVYLVKKRSLIIELADLIASRQRALIDSAEYYLKEGLLSFATD